MEIIDLSGHRQVIALHVDAGAVQQTLPPPIFGRADAGEFDKVANQMRLIEIAAAGRKLGRTADDGWCAPRARRLESHSPDC